MPKCRVAFASKSMRTSHRLGGFTETSWYERKETGSLRLAVVQKGKNIPADAFGRLCRERADIHLVLADPDDERYQPKVMSWLAAAGVLDRATFTGMLLGADQFAALAAPNLFVLPPTARISRLRWSKRWRADCLLSSPIG